ncbi:hypothetical protein ALC53_03805 [Atta colombica]|uniref:Uncharacterized protein n=1 Tax=Atta colombica TaxID=520822 RepID=A0A195BNE1_9HYME|nr:hypothetical protein ALC53_03805 [Atta colombica]
MAIHPYVRDTPLPRSRPSSLDGPSPLNRPLRFSRGRDFPGANNGANDNGRDHSYLERIIAIMGEVVRDSGSSDGPASLGCKEAIQNTPSKILLGYKQKNRGDERLKVLLIWKNKCNFIEQKELARDIANKKLREYNRRFYNERYKKLTLYSKDNYILVQTIIKESWYQQVLNNNRYIIKNILDFNISSRLYDTILSFDKLKPWVKPTIQFFRI